MNKSPKTAFSLLIPAVIFVAAGVAIFAFQNFSNKRVSVSYTHLTLPTKLEV